MNIQEYQAPSLAVVIIGPDGPQVLADPAEAEVRASRIAPLSSCVLRMRPDVVVRQHDEVAVMAGYDDQLTMIWTGWADQVEDGREVVVTCIDGLATCKATQVRKSWANATAQQVARDLAKLADIPIEIPAVGGERHIFSADKMSVFQALQGVKEAWALDWDLYWEPEGYIYFGPYASSLGAQQEDAYVLQRGTTLLSLTPGPERIEAEALYLPWIRRGSMVLLEDQDTFGEVVSATVERVRHSFAELRTELICQRLI